MPTTPDRDRSMERLLRTQLGAGHRAALPPVSDDCVDAETLAAWSDRALSPDESLKIEAHLADCARCQTLLATFAQTEPVVAAAVPFWQRWRSQWLVPIGALAAAGIALVIWTSSHRQTSSIQAPAATMASAAQPEVIVPPVPPVPVMESSSRFADKKLGNAASQMAESTLKSKSDLQAREQKDTPKAASKPAVGLVLPDAPPPTVAAPPPPPQPQPTLPPPAAPPPSTVTATLPSPPAARAAPPPAQTAAVSRSIVIDSASAAMGSPQPMVIAQFTSSAVRLDAVEQVGIGQGRGGGGGGGAGRGGAGGRSAPPAAAVTQSELVVPIRWRVLVGGVVEKSTTGGMTWDRITFDPPQTEVTGGVAPGSQICWLIGRKGTVLLSTDGTKFTPLTFPEAVDLRSITATDALHATVTTSEGKVYVTSNGGLSWTPQASELVSERSACLGVAASVASAWRSRVTSAWGWGPTRT